MQFEVFHRRRGYQRPSAEPEVTITRRGIISLNEPAYAAIGRPETVELLYDRAEQVIGLRPVQREAQHAYPVRSQGGKPGGPWNVHARGFTLHYGIDTSTAIRRPAVVEDGVLCINLAGEGSSRWTL